jgi:hemerythrin-like domain-containing protein
MEAVRILSYEHYIIKSFLDQLVKAQARIEDGDGPAPEFFEKAFAFCREYADKAHHYKEEHVMFTMLAQKHEGRLDGQIESHRAQHEELRGLVNEMSTAVPSYARGEAAGTDVLRECLIRYTTTLRKHIHSEDEVFFPMAELFLSEEEGEALLEEFRKYDAKVDGSFSEEGRRLVEELTDLL